ncbi:MAG: hypothetical protein AAFP78_14490, partial [Pseudomonadota bacterium]
MTRAESAPRADQAPAEALAAVFAFFNEVGIINQLSSALFQKRLPNEVVEDGELRHRHPIRQ